MDLFNIPLGELEELEDKYDLNIHMESDVGIGQNKYFFYRDGEDMIFGGYNLSELEKSIIKKLNKTK